MVVLTIGLGLVLAGVVTSIPTTPIFASTSYDDDKDDKDDNKDDKDYGDDKDDKDDKDCKKYSKEPRCKVCKHNDNPSKCDKKKY
jgi:hypothetical protein